MSDGYTLYIAFSDSSVIMTQSDTKIEELDAFSDCSI